MKNILLLIAAILFSTLFYGQNIGLNLSIFTIITIVVLSVLNFKPFKKSKTILTSLLYLISGITVFFQSSTLTIIANILAFHILIGYTNKGASSIYISWINGLYTSIASTFHRYQDLVVKTQALKDPKNKTLHWLKIIGIPFLVLTIFVLLYKNGNPVFSDLISTFDLSKINIQWALFTVLGYYLFYNIANPITIQPLTDFDNRTGNFLTPSEQLSLSKLDNEKQLGIVLISLLNILIIIFLITDIAYVLRINNLSAVELSNQVHSGIYTLIASIVLAIAIILYVFRGDFNFYEKNQQTKNMTFIWILLNIVLIGTIAFKNYLYIHSFGFTYKRIGVIIYLLLSFMGLISTFLKVRNIKNIWYLLRCNTEIAFLILIAASIINWDNAITSYNLNFAKKIDLNYLLDLPDNALILEDYSKDIPLNETQLKKINRKHANYIIALSSRSWQEMQYDNLQVTK